ncbi:MAG: hypothetical protein HQL95_00285 [Magnetococcales bacterium]|nr:hypothetical protein [Magnetococcales bacterium]
MAEISADLQVNFGSFDKSTTFDVMVDETGLVGDSPVQVEFSPDLTVKIISWEVAVWRGAKAGIPPILNMIAPGRKRIKVYCSKVNAASIKVFVDGGGGSVFSSKKPAWKPSVANPTASSSNASFGVAKPINWKGMLETATEQIKSSVAEVKGNRGDQIREAISWSGEIRKSLRYNYDSPNATVIHKSIFRNRDGDTIPAPVYDKDHGAFYTQEEAFGAIIVEYSPGYAMVNVTYDNGQNAAPPGVFEEMQTAWARGDITTAQIPPVQLLILSDNAAAVASFKREFWPKGCPGIQITGLPGLDDDTDKLTEIDGTRKTATEKIYLDEADPNVYVEVEKITYFEAQDEDTKRIMKLRMLNK